MGDMYSGDSRSNVREFRQLRSRLFQLDREIDEMRASLNLSAHSPATTDSSRMDYYLGLRLKQEERAEIQYVLDYFERLAYEWPSRSQWLFIAIVLIAMILAVIAIVQVL